MNGYQTFLKNFKIFKKISPRRYNFFQYSCGWGKEDQLNLFRVKVQNNKKILNEEVNYVKQAINYIDCADEYFWRTLDLGYIQYDLCKKCGHDFFALVDYCSSYYVKSF